MASPAIAGAAAAAETGLASTSGLDPAVVASVAATNFKVVAEAPAMGTGTLFQALSHSTGILQQNNVSGSRNTDTTALASATQNVTQIHSLDTIADAIGIAQIIKANA